MDHKRLALPMPLQRTGRAQVKDRHAGIEAEDQGIMLARHKQWIYVSRANSVLELSLEVL